MNRDRKLASIQEVTSINRIDGADRIESVGVLGWECVAPKGDFRVGDRCIYFELDSFLPIKPEFEILRQNSYKNSKLMGEGFRIKTQTFRGKLSQGFICKTNILPSGEYNLGDDVSDILGVKQWEREEEKDTFGKIIADIPAFIKRTNEYRIQSFPDVLDELNGKPYYITNKIDGVSTTLFNSQGELGVCGHDAVYRLETYKYLDVVIPVIEVLHKHTNLAIQGELAGPGILGNRAGFKRVCFNVFNIMDTLTREFYSYDEMIAFCTENRLKMVELDERGESFNYTIEELIDKADGVYQETGRRREGIVVRPINSERSRVLSDRLSFKVISNKYLLKNKE